MCTSKEENNKVLSSTSHQQMMSGHLLGSKASAPKWLLHKANIVNKQCLPFLLFYLAFICELTSCGMEYPFGKFGPVGLAVFPPRISLLMAREGCTALLLDPKHR